MELCMSQKTEAAENYSLIQMLEINRFWSHLIFGILSNKLLSGNRIDRGTVLNDFSNDASISCSFICHQEGVLCK